MKHSIGGKIDTNQGVLPYVESFNRALTELEKKTNVKYRFDLDVKDQARARELLEMFNEKSKNGMNDYYMTEKKALDKLLEARDKLQSLEKEAKISGIAGTEDYQEIYDKQANAIVRLANAYQALGGEASKAGANAQRVQEMLDFAKGREQVLMTKSTGGYQYTVRNFKELFDIMKELEPLLEKTDGLSRNMLHLQIPTAAYDVLEERAKKAEAYLKKIYDQYGEKVLPDGTRREVLKSMGITKAYRNFLQARSDTFVPMPEAYLNAHRHMDIPKATMTGPDGKSMYVYESEDSYTQAYASMSSEYKEIQKKFRAQRQKEIEEAQKAYVEGYENLSSQIQNDIIDMIDKQVDAAKKKINYLRKEQDEKLAEAWGNFEEGARPKFDETASTQGAYVDREAYSEATILYDNLFKQIEEGAITSDEAIQTMAKHLYDAVNQKKATPFLSGDVSAFQKQIDELTEKIKKLEEELREAKNEADSWSRIAYGAWSDQSRAERELEDLKKKLDETEASLREIYQAFGENLMTQELQKVIDSLRNNINSISMSMTEPTGERVRETLQTQTQDVENTQKLLESITPQSLAEAFSVDEIKTKLSAIATDVHKLSEGGLTMSLAEEDPNLKQRYKRLNEALNSLTGTFTVTSKASKDYSPVAQYDVALRELKEQLKIYESNVGASSEAFSKMIEAYNNSERALYDRTTEALGNGDNVTYNVESKQVAQFGEQGKLIQEEGDARQRLIDGIKAQIKETEKLRKEALKAEENSETKKARGKIKITYDDILMAILNNNSTVGAQYGWDFDKLKERYGKNVIDNLPLNERVQRVEEVLEYVKQLAREKDNLESTLAGVVQKTANNPEINQLLRESVQSQNTLGFAETLTNILTTLVSIASNVSKIAKAYSGEDIVEDIPNLQNAVLTERSQTLSSLFNRIDTKNGTFRTTQGNKKIIQDFLQQFEIYGKGQWNLDEFARVNGISAKNLDILKQCNEELHQQEVTVEGVAEKQEEFHQVQQAVADTQKEIKEDALDYSQPSYEVEIGDSEESIQTLASSVDKTNEVLAENTNLLTERQQNFEQEGQTVTQVVDSEVEKLGQLKGAVEGVTKAVKDKTKAFKKEGETVGVVLNGETQISTQKKRGRKKKSESAQEQIPQQETDNTLVDDKKKLKSVLMMERSTENLLYNRNLTGEPRQDVEKLLAMLKEVENTTGLTKDEWANIQLIVTDITNKAKSNINENKELARQEKEQAKLEKEKLQAQKEQEKILKAQTETEEKQSKKANTTSQKAQVQALDKSSLATNVETTTSAIAGIQQDVGSIKEDVNALRQAQTTEIYPRGNVTDGEHRPIATPKIIPIKKTPENETDKRLDNLESDIRELKSEKLGKQSNELAVNHSNELAETIKGWVEASNIMSQALSHKDSESLDRERIAYGDVDSGRISNAYIVGDRESISSELNALVVKTIDKLKYQLDIHSHPEDYIAPSGMNSDLWSYAKEGTKQALIVGRKQSLLLNTSMLSEDELVELASRYDILADQYTEDGERISKASENFLDSFSSLAQNMDYQKIVYDELFDEINNYFLSKAESENKKFSSISRDLFDDRLNQTNFDFTIGSKISSQNAVRNLLESMEEFSHFDIDDAVKEIADSLVGSAFKAGFQLKIPVKQVPAAVDATQQVLYQEALKDAFNELFSDKGYKFDDFARYLNYENPSDLTRVAINEFLGIQNTETTYLEDILEAIKEIVSLLNNNSVSLSSKAQDIIVGERGAKISKENTPPWYTGWKQEEGMRRVTHEYRLNSDFNKYKKSVKQGDKSDLEYAQQFYNEYLKYLSEDIANSEKEEKQANKRFEKYVKEQQKLNKEQIDLEKQKNALVDKENEAQRQAELLMKERDEKQDELAQRYANQQVSEYGLEKKKNEEALSKEKAKGKKQFESEYISNKSRQTTFTNKLKDMEKLAQNEYLDGDARQHVEDMLDRLLQLKDAAYITKLEFANIKKECSEINREATQNISNNKFISEQAKEQEKLRKEELKQQKEISALVDKENEAERQANLLLASRDERQDELAKTYANKQSLEYIEEQKKAQEEYEKAKEKGRKQQEAFDKAQAKQQEELIKQQQKAQQQAEREYIGDTSKQTSLERQILAMEKLSNDANLQGNARTHVEDLIQKLKTLQSSSHITEVEYANIRKEYAEINSEAQINIAHNKTIANQLKEQANIRKKSQDETDELVDKYQKILNKKNNEGVNYFTQSYRDQVQDALQQLQVGNITVAQGQTVLSGIDNPDYITGSSKTLKNYIIKGQKLIAQNYMPADVKKQFEGLVESMQQVSKQGGYSRTEISRLISSFQDLETEAAKAGKTLWGQVGQRLQDMNAKFIATYLSFHDMVRYAKAVINTITELDTAMTEMRKVSDETVTSLKEYQKTTFDTASTLGTTAVQLQQSTADWLRLGETMDQASKSAVAATTLLNVSEFDNINEATEALVSMSQAYKDLDKTEIIDVLNNIGNNYSIATDQLATALQASSAALVTQGNDLYEAAALVTAGNAIIQDASKVGTGIRTISLRIAGVKEGDDEIRQELEEMGEEVDDWVVSTEAKKRQVIMDYTRVASNGGKGVDILDANGNLKNTYTILLEISKIYKEIQEEDKKYGTNRAKGLVEELAGKVRSNIAASILMNPELLENVYNSALESGGSAAEENAKYLDSIVGKTQQFKNELQELEYTLADSETIKNIIDLGTNLLSLLNEFIKKIPMATNMIISLGAALIAMKKQLFFRQNSQGGVSGFGAFLEQQIKTALSGQKSKGILDNAIGDVLTIQDTQGVAHTVSQSFTETLEEALIDTQEDIGSSVSDIIDSSTLFDGAIDGKEVADAIIPPDTAENLDDKLENLQLELRNEIGSPFEGMDFTIFSDEELQKMKDSWDNAVLGEDTAAAIKERAEDVSESIGDSLSGALDTDVVQEITEEYGELGETMAETLAVPLDSVAESTALEDLNAQYDQLNGSVNNLTVSTEILDAADMEEAIAADEAAVANNVYSSSVNGADAANRSATNSTHALTTAVTAEGVANEATATAISLKNAALTFGITLAVQGLIKLISYVAKSKQRIEEAGELARRNIEDINKNLEKTTDTVDKVGKRYAELSQKVGNLGQMNQNQGGLSNDEYKEFLDISNQLAEVFPTLQSGYTDTNGAILNLNGSASEITATLEHLLEVEKELANAKILEEADDVFKDNLKDYKEQMKTAQFPWSDKETLAQRELELEEAQFNTEALKNRKKVYQAMLSGGTISDKDLDLIRNGKADIKPIISSSDVADVIADEIVNSASVETYSILQDVFGKDKAKEIQKRVNKTTARAIKDNVGDLLHGKLPENSEDSFINELFATKLTDVPSLFSNAGNQTVQKQESVFDFSELEDYEIEAIERYYAELTHQYENEVEIARSKVEQINADNRKYMMASLKSSLAYEEADDATKRMMESVLESFDMKDIPTSVHDWDGFMDWFNRTYIRAIEQLDDKELSNEIAKLFNDATLTATDKIDLIGNILESLTGEHGLSPDEPIVVYWQSQYEGEVKNREAIIDTLYEGMVHSKPKDVSDRLNPYMTEADRNQLYAAAIKDAERADRAKAGEWLSQLSNDEIALLLAHGVNPNLFTDLQDVKDYITEIEQSLYKLDDFEALLYSNSFVSENMQKRFDALQDEYDKELALAKTYGAELDRTVYGNVDLENRDALEWNTENLEKYKDAIESYGASIEDYADSLSTVDAMSGEFDGVEIAFTPILQTENGPEYLDKDTVYNYIDSLISQMPEGFTDADLFKLDAQGLEIEGRQIKGLIAAIGDEAVRVGETMHYLGDNGSLDIIKDQMDEFKKSHTTWNDIKQDLIGLAQAGKLDETTLKQYEWFDDMLKALGIDAEDADDYLSEMVNYINQIAVKNPVDDLANFHTEMDKLGDAYAKFQEGEFIDANTLSALQDAFGDLDSYQAFEKAVLTGETALQSYFNDIVSEYAYEHNLMGQLTEDQKDYYKQMLVRAGVTEETADAAVKGALEERKALEQRVEGVLDSTEADDVKLSKLKELILGTEELDDATIKQINDLIVETGITGESAEMVKYYAIQKDLAKHKDLRNEDDINYLIQVCELADIASTSLQSLKHLSENKAVFEQTIKDVDEELKKYSGRKNISPGEQAYINTLVARKETAQSALNQMGILADKAWEETASGFKEKFEQYEYKPNLDYNGIVDDAKDAGSDAAEAYKDALDKILALYDAELDAGVISFQTYVDKSRAIIEQYYKDGKITAQEYYDELSDFYSKQVTQYDKVISAVQKSLQDEQDALEKQKENIEKSYNEQIEVIQKKIDALQDENDEIDRNMELSKASYELARARNQRTRLMYSEARGFYYEADLKGIADAEDNLRKAKMNKQIADYEKQIKSLQDAMESEASSIDDQIKKLSEYSEAWGKVSTQLEEAQNRLRATEILGPDWENNIKNGLSLLQDFTDQYITAQQNQKNAYLEARRAEAENPVGGSGGGGNTGGNTATTGNPHPTGGNTSDLPANWDSQNHKITQQGVWKYDGKIYPSEAEANAIRNQERNAIGESAYKTAYDNAYQQQIARGNKQYADSVAKEEAEKAKKNALASFDSAKKVVRANFTGTDSAQRGESLVGEFKPEIVVHKNGTASIVEEPTLMDLQGGEKIFNGEETEKILKSKYRPLQSVNPNKFKMLHSFAGGTTSPMQRMIAAQAVGIASGINNGLVSTSNIGGQTINQTFNLSLPNITDASKATDLMRELQQLSLKATQHFNRRS